MTITVTRTKIIIPRRRADLLSRKRLTDLLDDLLDYKLLLIAAPAGYGKTSLLVDWVHQNELPVCWYALDPLDQDFQRFVNHFIASISQVFPIFGKQSQAVLQSATQSELDLNRIMTTIVNDAYEHIKEHFVIILDDFHAVDSSDEINDFVNRFVEEIDENCHLVIASRTLLSLSNLPLMVGRSMVKGLSYDELAFQADEIQALLKQNYRQTISAEVAAELERETEGWITGLLLSAKTMWDGMTDRIRVARASGVGLYDYLAQQVLNQQPPLVRDFLLKTSLLEEFDAELCEAVLGDAPEGINWFSLIGEVLQNNLFVLPVDNKGTWLRYHHLFRDFLQAQISREYPEEADRILRRFAKVYTERGMWEKAYEIYQRLEDKAGIVNLIEQAGTPMLKNGRLNILTKWLAALTLDELTSHPALLSLQGTVEFLLGNVERGISKLDQAEIAFRSGGDLPQLARVFARRATGHRFMGNYQKSISDTDEALTIASDFDNLQEVQAEALRVRGLCLHNTGQLAIAIDYLEKALFTYNSLGDTSNEALSQLDLGLVHMSAGRFPQALSHYKHALDHWRQSGNIVTQSNVLNNLGVLHHLRGDYDQAWTFLFEALSLARKSGNARIEAYSLASLGDIYADLDMFDTAREAYRQAREISARIDNRFLLLYSYLAETTLSRKSGDLSRASDLLGMAENLVQESDSVYEQGLYQLISGQIALANGNAEGAVDVLGEALHCFDAGGQIPEAIRAHISLARAYFALGDVQQCWSYLKCAIRPVSDTGDLHSLIVAGREAKDLLNNVPIPPAITQRITHLLKQVDKFERRIPGLRRKLRQCKSVITFEQPPKLAIQTMGITQVSLSGEPVTSSEWVNQRAVRELFFLLLAHPDGLSKEAIGLFLWPDSSPRQLRMQFKNALYRLRRALGRDVVVFNENEDLYRFNGLMDYEYDVETFRDKISQGQNASSQKQRMAAYRSAVRLCRGIYLPDVDGSWVALEREQLWQAYLRAELALAQYALDNGKYQAVLDHVHAILSKDPCQEEAHRLAMQAHAALGNRADLVRQFEICKNILNSELGVSPSPRTETLYEQLLMENID